MAKFTVKAYLRDKLVELTTIIVVIFTTICFCGAFRLRYEIVIILLTPMVLGAIGVLIFEYWRRKKFYETLRLNLQKLDQAYLVTEMIRRPGFLDGQILHDTCYEIDKSMLENIGKIAQANRDFSEYIELWIHEIKSPLVALNLLVEKMKASELDQELARIDTLAGQVLYFVRAQSSTEDYLLGGCELDEIVKTVLLAYRTQIQLQKVGIVAKELNFSVHSDVKWLKFMIGQVLANALKYDATRIELSAQKDARGIILKIRDNGIGIPEEDLPRVFEKGFTGKNGHRQASTKSTGMGLYLVEMMCKKLGHRVKIESKTGKDHYTEVQFYFGEHEYYKNVR